MKNLSIFLCFVGVLISAQTPENQQIEEVKITAIKKTMTQENGKLVMSITDDPIFQNLSINEALQYLPNVTVSEDKISVLGRSNVLILIDGRESVLDIKNLRLTMVEKIELVDNAGAKYDGKYDAVINVVMNRWANQGFFGDFTPYAHWKNRRFAADGKLVLQYNKNRFSSGGSYLYGQGANLQKDLVEQQFANYDTYQKIFTNNFNREHRGVFWSNYQLTENQNFGLEFGINQNFSEKNMNNYQEFFANKGQVPSPAIFTNDRGSNRLFDYSGNAYYNLKKEFFTLDTYLYYSNKDGDEKNDTNSYNRERENFDFYNTYSIDHLNPKNKERAFFLSTHNKRNANNLTYNLAMSSTLDEKNTLEYGARVVSLFGNFKLNIPNVGTNLNIKFNETVYALYADWSGKINDKTNFQLGNRVEYFHRDLDITKQNQWVFLPSLALQYQPSRKHSWAFSASKRTYRVPFLYIMPFYYQLSYNNIFLGNPDLKNQINYNVDLRYGYNNTWFFTPYFSYAENAEAQGFQTKGNLLRVLRTNLDTWESGVSFNFTKALTPWWRANYQAEWSLFSNGKIALDENYSDKKSIIYQFNLTNSFSLGKFGNIVSNARYNTPVYRGTFYMKRGFRLNLKYNKRFFKNKLDFTFSINDILKTYYENIDNNVGGYRTLIQQYNGWQYVAIWATYRFGKGKKANVNKSQIDSSESQRL